MYRKKQKRVGIKKEYLRFNDAAGTGNLRPEIWDVKCVKFRDTKELVAKFRGRLEFLKISVAIEDR